MAAATTGAVHGARLARLRTPRGVAVGSAVLVAPTGERAAGLSVRVGL